MFAREAESASESDARERGSFSARGWNASSSAWKTV
jgi:hypothetical protein